MRTAAGDSAQPSTKHSHDLSPQPHEPQEGSPTLLSQKRGLPQGGKNCMEPRADCTSRRDLNQNQVLQPYRPLPLPNSSGCSSTSQPPAQMAESQTAPVSQAYLITPKQHTKVRFFPTHRSSVLLCCKKGYDSDLAKSQGCLVILKNITQFQRQLGASKQVKPSSKCYT